jgi:hypothetical protein
MPANEVAKSDEKTNNGRSTTGRVRLAKAAFLLLAIFGLGACNFRFETASDGVGVAWPCGTIRYAVNPAGASASDISAVHTAMWEAGLLMGRSIVFEGTTTETTANGSARGRIVVEWTTALPAGKTGWADADTSSDGRWYIGANILIRKGAPRQYPVIAHEVGHALGLVHVSDPAELMHPNALADTWGHGDRAALAQVGKTRC